MLKLNPLTVIKIRNNFSNCCFAAGWTI